MIRGNWWLVAASIVCGLAGAALMYTSGYSAGVSAEAARREARDTRLLHDALDRATRAGTALRDIGTRVLAAMEESRETETETVRTVIEVIRENPDFAAVQRPADLGRLRRDQLEAIARAVDPDQL